MKIDFGHKSTEPDGTLLPERPPEMVKNDRGEMEEKNYPIFTLKKACVNVLLGLRLMGTICPKCKRILDKDLIKKEVEKREKADNFMNWLKDDPLWEQIMEKAGEYKKLKD